MSHLFIHISSENRVSVYIVHACYTCMYILLAKYKIEWVQFLWESFLLLFSSLTLITHLPFSPHLPAAQAADLLHLLKVKSDQPLTPCWDIWTFCCCTSHLPKLAWITVSHEQLNCACGRQHNCTVGGKGGRCCQVGLEGFLRRAHAGMRADAIQAKGTKKKEVWKISDKYTIENEKNVIQKK